MPEAYPAARRRQKGTGGAHAPRHARALPRALRGRRDDARYMDAHVVTRCRWQGRCRGSGVSRTRPRAQTAARGRWEQRLQYLGNIPQLVIQPPEQERAAWELIRPLRCIPGYLVRSDAGSVCANVASKLGVSGWALFGEMKDEQAGWLVRTKPDNVHEGGVATGSGMLDLFLSTIETFPFVLSKC